MTGPEHYREAELLLAEADNFSENGGDMGQMLAAAQVHALLALAAATALPTGGAGTAARGEWAMTVSGISDGWKPGMRNA